MRTRASSDSSLGFTETSTVSGHGIHSFPHAPLFTATISRRLKISCKLGVDITHSLFKKLFFSPDYRWFTNVKPGPLSLHPEQGMGLFSKLSLSLLFLSAAAFAQLPFGVGVKAGVPITDGFSKTQLAPNSFASSDSKNYII